MEFSGGHSRLTMLTRCRCADCSPTLRGRGFQYRRRWLLFAEFAFPLRYHHGRQAIPDYVDRGARHVHQLVNAEDDEDGLDREIETGSRAKKDDQACAWNGGDAFRCE